MKKQSNVIDQSGILFDSLFPFLDDESRLSKLLENDEYHKYAENEHIEQVEHDYSPVVWKVQKVAASEDKNYPYHEKVSYLSQQLPRRRTENQSEHIQKH